MTDTEYPDFTERVQFPTKTDGPTVELSTAKQAWIHLESVQRDIHGTIVASISVNGRNVSRFLALTDVRCKLRKAMTDNEAQQARLKAELRALESTVERVDLEMKKESDANANGKDVTL